MIDAVAVIAAIGTILTAVVVAGMNKKWVWGYQLADMTKERDFWRNQAMRGTGVAEKAIERIPAPEKDPGA